MTDAPLRCPYCGVMPNVDLIGRVRCKVWDCPPSRDWFDLDHWNAAAMITAPAVGAEAAHRFISFAIVPLSAVIPDENQDARRLKRGIGFLRQALDALRPPAAPASMAFWLGREA